MPADRFFAFSFNTSMASGRTHISGTLVLTPITVMTAWQLSHGDLNMSLIAGLGCLSGVIISPDLDMAGRTISESIVLRWNILLGRLWIMLWFPYAMIHKHRGLSHVPIFGTMSRVLYITICYTLIHYVLLHYYAINLLVWPQLHWLEVVIFIAGLTVSDLGHWVLDGCKLGF